MSEPLRAPENVPIVNAKGYPERVMGGWMRRLTARFLAVETVVRQRVIDGGTVSSTYGENIFLDGGAPDSTYDALHVLDLGGVNG